MAIIKTPKLETIAQELEIDELDDEEIAEILNGADYDPNNVVSFVTETLIRNRLRKICEREENFVYNPIEDTRTVEYRFIRIEERTLVRERKSRRSRKKYTDIDALFVVKNLEIENRNPIDLPVLVNICMSRYKSKGKKGNSTEKLLSPSQMEIMIDPLREYFETHDFGYFAVFPGEHMYLDISGSVKDFERRNGIPVAIGHYRQDTRKKIEAIAKKAREAA